MSLEWWKKNVIYHIYLPSFKDSNGDGVGDIKGLIEKLDYFRKIGVSTLLLSPFYPSPMKDNGYDITSFTDVDPLFGTLQDFEALISQVKQRKLNILVDFVANHTSNLHPWFVKSVQKEEPYTDYFIWKDAKDFSNGNPSPPNNWLSVFNGPAWTWNEERKQFYFHQFLPEQPDLNYRNPLVREEMKKVLHFWLEKGVDGFRIDAASHLFEDERFLDEPLAEETTAKPGEHDYLEHIYTKGQTETFELLEEWRQVLDDEERKTNKPKILLVEGMEEVSSVCRYYGSFDKRLAEVPMNFQLYKVTATSTALELRGIIQEWMTHMPKGKYPNWVLSSHDFPRVWGRVGPTLASSLQMVQMLLPGTPICYYGDELGMGNGHIHPRDMKDSFALRTTPSNSRDPMRTPMQWTPGVNAGFSEAKETYLPLQPDYVTRNVEVQSRDPFSPLAHFQKLVRLRGEAALLLGPLRFLPGEDDGLLCFVRPIRGAKSYLVVVNMASTPQAADLNRRRPASLFLPDSADLELTNPGCSALQKSRNRSFTFGADEVDRPNIRVPLSAIPLSPHQGMVLSFVQAGL